MSLHAIAVNEKIMDAIALAAIHMVFNDCSVIGKWFRDNEPSVDWQRAGDGEINW